MTLYVLNNETVFLDISEYIIVAKPPEGLGFTPSPEGALFYRLRKRILLIFSFIFLNKVALPLSPAIPN